MTVGELKAIHPLSDVYELRLGIRYLILGSRKLATNGIFQAMAQAMHSKGLDCMIALVDDVNAVRIFDFGEPSRIIPFDGNA